MIGSVQDQASIKDDAVRINSGPIGRQCKITIGDTIIPVMAADIRIRPDELVTVECTLRAKDVDIQALKSETRLTIVEGDE